MTCGYLRSHRNVRLDTCPVPTNCRWTGRKGITSSSRIIAFWRLLYTWQIYKCIVWGRSVLFSTLISECTITHIVGTDQNEQTYMFEVYPSPDVSKIHHLWKCNDGYPRGSLCNGQCWCICQIRQSRKLCLMWCISDTCVLHLTLKLNCCYKRLKRLR